MTSHNKITSVRVDDETVKQHLVAFARTFVLHERAERYRTLASSPRGLQKWRGELDHFQRRLRTELAEPIPARLRTVDALRELLGQEPPQAVVFSTNPRLLAGIGEILSTLDDVINTDIGAIVSILPGELALYWGEERDAKFLLRAEP